MWLATSPISPVESPTGPILFQSHRAAAVDGKEEAVDRVVLVPVPAQDVPVPALVVGGKNPWIYR